ARFRRGVLAPGPGWGYRSCAPSRSLRIPVADSPANERLCETGPLAGARCASGHRIEPHDLVASVTNLSRCSESVAISLEEDCRPVLHRKVPIGFESEIDLCILNVVGVLDRARWSLRRHLGDERLARTGGRVDTEIEPI